jgi:YHS domain-containing protein
MAGIHTDPVCGMEITNEDSQATSEYQGQKYYFCSMECKNTFEMDPERYVHQHQEHGR